VLFSLPEAIGMYGLSLGVQHMDEILPPPVYALLSGLNSSIVGIIALAAVQLAEKAIKDNLHVSWLLWVRLLACAITRYGTSLRLWQLAALLLFSGTAGCTRRFHKIRAQLIRTRSTHEAISGEAGPDESIILEHGVDAALSALQRRANSSQTHTSSEARRNRAQPSEEDDGTLQPVADSDHIIRIRIGLGLVILFFGKLLTSSRMTLAHN
jgi:hypothetical protein